MKSLLSSKPGTAHGPGHTGTAMPGNSPSAPGPFVSFLRFVGCGGGVGVLSSAAVPLLAALMPWAAANALITIASTILCTELHALFTFGTGRRPGLRRHWQSAGSATGAYLATSAAILVLHLIQPAPTMLTAQVVYLSASGLAGIGRFLVLRLFVFTTHTPTLNPTDRTTITVPVRLLPVTPAYGAAA